ncbi:MAG: class II fructose-bisphosphate aldolase [Dehalococcoidales bacterium]|nr:class II fructose-bisphosphate aldolase [Dehalococcoidales bacterium]
MANDYPAAENIDELVRKAALGDDEPTRQKAQREIRDLASERGITPASIQGLYEASGKELYRGVTVPAINVRGITYQVARAVFRAALKHQAGAFIFEIARSEIGYTRQPPSEYTACVLAAAIREKFQGPVFIQGDHFQANHRRYTAEPDKELNDLKTLIRSAIAAGFFNIDIDASTLVDLSAPTLEEQQTQNCLLTAELTKFIRSIEPQGTTVSVGGEIGEVGARNSTVADLRAFMSGYLGLIGPGMKGISKISVQTGTTHGGVVLPDGSIAKVKLDFQTLEKLSQLAREEYGLAGAVQHGASTLPEEVFKLFPQSGTAEVHLATGFQNLIFDSPHFPEELKDRIYAGLSAKYADQRKPEDTEEQFIYRTRKRAFGDFKSELWNLPEENLRPIGERLESSFAAIFQELNVVKTVDLVARFVTR